MNEHIAKSIDPKKLNQVFSTATTAAEIGKSVT